MPTPSRADSMPRNSRLLRGEPSISTVVAAYPSSPSVRIEVKITAT